MGNPISGGGELQDFIPRPGNPVPSQRISDSVRQKWGGREFITNYLPELAGGARSQVTLVETVRFKEPRTINLQLRFAPSTTSAAQALISNVPGQPVLPFVYAPPGTVTRCTVTVRRGVSEDASPTEDVYVLNNQDPLTIDNITCTQLSVTVQATGIPLGGANIGSNDSRFFVECLACPVDNVGPKNLSYPYNVAANPGINTNVGVGPFTILPANTDRMHFIIVNTSTDRDLLVQLGTGPNGLLPTWAGGPIGSFVLPRGGFATYEGQGPYCSKMSVTIVWSNAGTGGVMFSEGTIY